MSRTDYPPVLVVDIETTSDHRYNAGIVEIGALWLEPAKESAAELLSFEMKCRPHEGCEPHQARALEVNGCDWLDDPTVAPEVEALESFAEWIKHATPINQWPMQKHGGWIVMAGMNVGQFDFTNLQSAFHRAGLVFPFAHRVVDVQTLAFANAAIHGQSLLKAGGMTSSDVQTMLGLPIEPQPHRALCGALLEGHALYELLYMTGKAPVEWGMLERRFFPELGNAPLLKQRENG